MRPQARDVLAFKTLSLNEETWTPELSPYRTAEVRSTCRGGMFSRVASFFIHLGFPSARCLGLVCLAVSVEVKVFAVLRGIRCQDVWLLPLLSLFLGSEEFSLRLHGLLLGCPFAIAN